MNYFRKPARLVFLGVLSLVTIISLVQLSPATGTITKADLSGAWVATTFGSGGCGTGTSRITFTLNGNGTGLANLQSHSAGCGDTTANGQPVNITSLTGNGSGTLGLACGTGCGFTLAIQVSPDRSTFNLVDVTDPGNFLEGVAVHQ